MPESRFPYNIPPGQARIPGASAWGDGVPGGLEEPFKAIQGRIHFATRPVPASRRMRMSGLPVDSGNLPVRSLPSNP
ncbi:MAG: hypothetical protein JWP91_1366 [Fibrobacteres bacterium]|nr:hypothetical protein [Fibrobacterota bacterium]